MKKKKTVPKNKCKSRKKWTKCATEEERKARLAASQKRFRERNKEKVNGWQRDWREKNPDKVEKYKKEQTDARVFWRNFSGKFNASDLEARIAKLEKESENWAKEKADILADLEEVLQDNRKLREEIKWGKK
ncbi:MAG: hypothetical protein LBC64_01805 [Fibromonadaceae bacterium]|jgi:hypothetical protein|nr:hypothetical protein [Fibromonadaceae bacterium]